MQAYNKSAMSFAKMEDLHKQIAWTNFDILKFRLGTEAWGIKPKKSKMISFVLFPQALVPSLNYWSIIHNSV